MMDEDAAEPAMPSPVLAIPIHNAITPESSATLTSGLLQGCPSLGRNPSRDDHRIPAIPKSFLAMWSATRIACAAMVSAGLVAADDGKKEASTTNRFSWSKERQNSFRAALLGSL